MNMFQAILDVKNIFPEQVTNEFINQMPRRELTAEEKSKPYARFYDKDMAPIPQEDLDKINAGPVSQKKALHFRDRNRMLESGNLETETGYCLLEDGIGFAATKVFMKDVTPAMLDWWFNWHPIEGLRYAIWCPIAHTDCSAGDSKGHRDSCGVDRHTRNYGKKHYPVEGFDVKGAQQLCIHFRTPEQFGLDMTKFKEPNISCLYAGTVQREFLGVKLPINVLMHCIREVEGGLEFRSRYWLGATINRKGEVVKFKMPYPKKWVLAMARNNTIHSLTEYNNLASILPELYREYGHTI